MPPDDSAARCSLCSQHCDAPDGEHYHCADCDETWTLDDLVEAQWDAFCEQFYGG